jgi:hypothetical protein
LVPTGGTDVQAITTTAGVATGNGVAAYNNCGNGSVSTAGNASTGASGTQANDGNAGCVVITYSTANNHTSTLSVANSAGTDMFRVQDDGEALFKAANNSPQALQIQNSSGSNLFSADTNNWRVYIGPTAGDTTGALLVLGNKTNSGDPTGVAGAMYYNSSLNAFRCYQNGLWQNCLLDGDGMTTESFTTDDFLNNGTSGGNGSPWTCAAISTGTMPGGAVTGRSIVVPTSSTSANSGFECGSGTDQLIGGGETFEMLIEPLTFTNTTVRFGFMSTFAAAAPTNGCWVNITNAGVLSQSCSKAGTLSSGGLNYSPAAGTTWYRVKITIASTTSVTTTVYSSAGVVLATDTYTPSNGEPIAAVGSGFTATNSGTSATALDNIDEISTWYNGLSFR